MILKGIMHLLNFPVFEFRFTVRNELEFIFDPVRVKYVRLTPEEWVRQHVIAYLNTYKGVPFSLMGVEKLLKLNGLSKRCDVVVYNRNGTPLLLVECKAPGVPVSQAVFDQAARYNLRLQVSYLMITNGLEHYSCLIDYAGNAYSFLEELPAFSEMASSL